MENVKGTVERLVSSPGRGRALGKTAWAIVVAGIEYSCGFFKPRVNVGDVVIFEAEDDGRYKKAFRIGLAADPGAPLGRAPTTPPQRLAPSAAPSAGSGPASSPSSGAPLPSHGAALAISAEIVTTWTKTYRPEGWTIDTMAAEVRRVAKDLER